MTSYMAYAIKCDREQDNPMDSTQCIVWDPDSRGSFFYIGGWDGFAAGYEIVNGARKSFQRKWEYFFHYPVLSIALCHSRDGSFLFVGLANGTVGCIDIRDTSKVKAIGRHEGGVHKMYWNDKNQILYTLGYDYSLKVWMMVETNGSHLAKQIKLPFKTFAGAFDSTHMMICAQNGKIAVVSLQSLFTINSLDNEYTYIFQQNHGYVKITCASIHGRSGRIALGTADGRLIMATFKEYGGSSGRFSKPYISRHQKKGQFRKQCFGTLNSVELVVKDGRNDYVIYSGSFDAGLYNIQKMIRQKTLTTVECPTTLATLSPDGETYVIFCGMDWCKGLDELMNNPVSPKIVGGKFSSTDLGSANLR